MIYSPRGKNLEEVALAVSTNSVKNASFQDVIGGLTAGISSVVFAVTFAGLLFSGGLDEALPRYIGLSLLGTAIVTAVLSLFSSYPAVIASSQDYTPVVLTALMAAILVRDLEGANVVSAIAGIAISTLATGAFFAIFGLFRLGRLIRYVPYPVIGGFLAGTGWVLVIGGVALATGLQIEHAAPQLLLTVDVLVRWLPALIFALLLYFITARYKHYLVWPSALVGGILLFYIASLLLGSSPADMSAAGWTLGPFPDRAPLELVTAAELDLVAWDLLAEHANLLLPILVVSAIGLLLNINGLELG